MNFMNPMQAETPKTLGLAILRALNYLKTCFFFLFSIGLGIIVTIFGYEPLQKISSDFFIQLGILLTLVLFSMFFIALDLRRVKKSRGTISMAFRIMAGSFIFIFVFTDVIYYVISMFGIGMQSWGTDEMKQNTEHLFDKAELVNFVSIIWYPIFFNGNEIMSWIRKRDKLIDEYESNHNN